MISADLPVKALVSGSPCYRPGSRHGAATQETFAEDRRLRDALVPMAPARVSRPESYRGLSFVRGDALVAGAREAQAPYRGSRMTDRQIGQAALRGRLVTALVGGREVSGYACGSDSYHWALVDPTGRVWLVHKSSTIRIGTDGDLAAETDEARASVERVAGPFREYVRKSQRGPHGAEEGEVDVAH